MGILYFVSIIQNIFRAQWTIHHQTPFLQYFNLRELPIYFSDLFFRIDTKAFRVRVWRGYSVSRMLHTKCPVLRAASLIYSDSFSGSVVVLFICTAEIAHYAIN
jgi:hypothetical protein